MTKDGNIAANGGIIDMKKDMITLTVQEFIDLVPDDNIWKVRNDAEYQFDYESWKIIIYSSGKLKFILRYIQGIFRWMETVADLSDLRISISAIVVDKFNFSIFKNDLHIFNCSLSTNFYLISEDEWAKKITEFHYSNFDIVDGDLTYNALELGQWKGEEGFGKFINMLLMLIRETDKFKTSSLPIQWIVEFKDRKLSMSRIRMQIESLQNRKKPDNNFLTSNSEDETPKEDLEQSKRPSLGTINQEETTSSWNKYYKTDK
ncbi:hypothetical protein P344_03305 [Spiroplasma mirum ATCC 29335]|uniref:Uncharacterized protein n=2 Tax=Spiroplasma mirum TaxID=2144 RepID=W0GPH0_9MOLU|nr:hypothetical protein [Spiroplasma atrichopogonis]AHF60983.1 hypothetical protein SMM_0558 [Spiroplasma mirum ATCC 29335]AHI58004.1 hypothetical protein P344_03305 [Spiroplasma mirum ATCC 29335]AKM53085.1 hypothetical protein SATRI_v1c06130 [Spiroplasma atrichopogonis]